MESVPNTCLPTRPPGHAELLPRPPDISGGRCNGWWCNQPAWFCWWTGCSRLDPESCSPEGSPEKRVRARDRTPPPATGFPLLASHVRWPETKLFTTTLRCKTNQVLQGFFNTIVRKTALTFFRFSEIIFVWATTLNLGMGGRAWWGERRKPNFYSDFSFLNRFLFRDKLPL